MLDNAQISCSGVKQLLGQHALLEQEMAAYNSRIKEIVAKSEAMAAKGHYARTKILENTRAFTKRYFSQRISF